jgi:putative toxin-antitoxin system antitoxin component (TIGR02293 family)
MKQYRSKPQDLATRIEESPVVYGMASEPSSSAALATEEVVARIREGLAMAEFTALCAMLDIGAEQLAGHLAMSRSTLVRRRRTGRLDALESDRLVRFARLFARAQEVLGDAEAARAWLRTPARALAFAVPLAYAETETGAREVENLLGRIAYGVFS